MDYTLIGLQNTFCFLEGIIIVSTGSESKINYVLKCLKKLNEDRIWSSFEFFKHLQKCHFDISEIGRLAYRFNQTGNSPFESKIAAILTVPPPIVLKRLR